MNRMFSRLFRLFKLANFLKFDHTFYFDHATGIFPQIRSELLKLGRVPVDYALGSLCGEPHSCVLFLNFLSLFKVRCFRFHQVHYSSKSYDKILRNGHTNPLKHGELGALSFRYFF